MFYIHVPQKQALHTMPTEFEECGSRASYCQLLSTIDLQRYLPNCNCNRFELLSFPSHGHSGQKGLRFGIEIHGLFPWRFTWTRIFLFAFHPISRASPKSPLVLPSVPNCPIAIYIWSHKFRDNILFFVLCSRRMLSRWAKQLQKFKYLFSPATFSSRRGAQAVDFYQAAF